MHNNFLFTHFLLVVLFDFIFIFALLLFCIFHSVAMNNAARNVESTSATIISLSTSSLLPNSEGPSSASHMILTHCIRSACVLCVCAFDYYGLCNARATIPICITHEVQNMMAKPSPCKHTFTRQRVDGA